MEKMEASVKNFIRSLLTSTPMTLRMHELNRDYRNTIGEPIPYHRLNYNSLEHFLKSIPDTVLVRGSGPYAELFPVISEKSAHVNDLVSRQRVSKPKVKKRKGDFFTPRSHLMPVSPKQNQQPVRKIHYPTHGFSLAPNVVNNTLPFDNTSLSFSDISDQMNDLNLSVSNDNYIGANDLEKAEYVKHEEIKSCTDIAPKKHYFFKSSCMKSQNEKKVPSEEIHSNVPSYIQNNLRRLIRKFPEGIWCINVPEEYKKMFNSDLIYQEYGYRNLIDLCVNLPSVFHYVRPSTDDFKLYDASRPLPECAEKKFTVASYSVGKTESEKTNGALPNIDWADALTFLPEDIFLPGKEIPRAFVSSDMQENDNVDVVVSEIYDLSKFWVYLVDSPLDDLMDAMQEFYRIHAEEYRIPEQLITVGLYCVQIIFGEYHRALVVDIMPELEGMVRVIFIDYGTMTKVSMKGMCFLSNRFADLPAQAIRCRLAYVCPIEEGAPWFRETVKAFRNIIYKKDLSAKISHIYWEEQFLEVFLADVTDENNIYYINDRLVEEGFAQYPDKEQRKSIVDCLYTPLVKHLHLFPTFLELENGLAPSTAEMEVLHDCNMPINFCYPQYFHIDTKFQESLVPPIEQFHEDHCMEGKRKPAYSYDLGVLKKQELDFSVFGEMESEIREFLNKPVEKFNKENSENDVTEHKEVNENINHTDEEVMEKLKKDYLLSEDIMRDLNMYFGSNKERFLSDHFVTDCEQTSTVSTSKESLEDNLTVIYNNATENAKQDHPLTTMSFDVHEISSSCNSESSFTICDDYLKLSDVDDHFKLPDFSYHKLEKICEGGINSSYETNSSCSDKKESVNSTNPFQEALDQNENADVDLSIDELKLNPNNPFLHYLSDDCDEPCTQEEEKIQHSWMKFEDISPEVISMLGKSLATDSVKSSKTSSNYSISTQTSNAEDKSCQSNFNYPCERPLVYSSWSVDYANQYSYNAHQPVNYQPYVYPNTYRPEYRTILICRPAYTPTQRCPIPPPPGLEPVPQQYPRNLFPVPQDGMNRHMFSSGIVSQPAQYGASPLVNLASTSSDDFYQVYNNWLKKKAEESRRGSC